MKLTESLGGLFPCSREVWKGGPAGQGRSALRGVGRLRRAPTPPGMSAELRQASWPVASRRLRMNKRRLSSVGATRTRSEAELCLQLSVK